MTTFITHPNTDGMVKFKGFMRNLKQTRASASFVLTETDKTKMGAIAIAAALAGQGGAAMGTAANANSMGEEADYVEFEVDGNRVQGWVWRNPFKEGDMVEVAAQQEEGRWVLYAIARPKDRLIALYPHCSRSKAPHTQQTIKMWLYWGGGLILFFVIPAAYFILGVKALTTKEFIFPLALGLMTFFALIAYSTSSKLMPFVRLAEKVFRTLEFANPENVDLKKSAKEKCTEQDKKDPNYGYFYFRY